MKENESFPIDGGRAGMGVRARRSWPELKGRIASSACLSKLRPYPLPCPSPIEGEGSEKPQSDLGSGAHP
jgi:hypothetical protein